MNIELRYVEVAGRRIPITGTFRQEGEGNTAATIGGVIAAGVFAGFITGKTAVIPAGRELKAYTQSEIALALPRRPAPRPDAPPYGQPVQSVPVAARYASAVAPSVTPGVKQVPTPRKSMVDPSLEINLK